MLRQVFIFLLFVILFIFFHKPAFAVDVVINEFVANPNTGEKEWVEFYNPDNLDISSYWIDDDTTFSSDTGNTSKKQLASIDLSNPKFPVFILSSSMFNDKCDPECDYVVLFSSDGTLLDQYQYTSEQIKQDGKSIGRSPDGSNNWVLLELATKGATNSSAEPTPTLTAIPTITPTNTRTPTPTVKPTSASTPTKNPTPTKIPTPTSKPTSVSSIPTSIEPTVELIPTSALGESTEKEVINEDKPSNISPSTEAKVLGIQANYLSKILISIGITFLLACGILAFRNYAKSRQDRGREV